MEEVKRPRMEVSGGESDEATEDRRGVFRVGEPVVPELAPASLRQSVQEVLVLVRVEERCLAVGHREEAGPKEEEEDAGGSHERAPGKELETDN